MSITKKPAQTTTVSVKALINLSITGKSPSWYKKQELEKQANGLRDEALEMIKKIAPKVSACLKNAETLYDEALAILEVKVLPNSLPLSKDVEDWNEERFEDIKNISPRAEFLLREFQIMRKTTLEYIKTELAKPLELLKDAAELGCIPALLLLRDIYRFGLDKSEEIMLNSQEEKIIFNNEIFEGLIQQNPSKQKDCCDLLFKLTKVPDHLLHIGHIYLRQGSFGLALRYYKDAAILGSEGALTIFSDIANFKITKKDEYCSGLISAKLLKQFSDIEITYALKEIKTESKNEEFGNAAAAILTEFTKFIKSEINGAAQKQGYDSYPDYLEKALGNSAPSP